MQLYQSSQLTNHDALFLQYVLRYFRKMLVIFSSAPFYTTYVQLPRGNQVLSRIRNDPKLYPYFKDALGAIDGSHIHCSPPSAVRDWFRNRKGTITQNCLFICLFAFRFLFALTGWEGSATDARVFEDALSKGLHVPPGKYYLADAGYPSCHELLVPYCGVCYHLAEWGRAGLR